MASKTPVLKDCGVCGEVFTSNAAHRDHVMSHDLGIGRSERCRLRPVSCWRCAGPIEIQVTTSCSCGFDLADHGYSVGNR